MPWTAVDIPDQRGRVFVITGANSGLGLESVRALARRRATIVMACRGVDKAEAAAAEVLAETPSAQLDIEPLDLADLDSVRAFADRVRARHPAIDVLLNNAGVMAIPRRETAQGFEMQFGTNHLGHFALTGHLLGALEASPAARVVTVSSTAHRFGTMRFGDLMGEEHYECWAAYGQSKLANLLFTRELDRRLRAAGRRTICVAAHPGYAATNLQFVGPQMDGSSLGERLSGWANRVFAQSAAQGALPQLYAATAPGIAPGGYYGPDGALGIAGHPAPTRPRATALDDGDAATLWERSVELTGVDFGGL